MYDSVGVSIESPVTSPRGAAESEYYYTLVFPNTKTANESESSAIPLTGARISFAAAQAILRSVTSGGKEREAQAIAEFRLAWVAKFRTPSPAATDMVPTMYFQELLRELIVQRFDAIPDLFLKTSVSTDQRLLMISFRPSKALLCATADRLSYKVAMMHEVDPGEAYWSVDPSRASTEAYQWSRADAQEQLYRLFLAGKIPTEDAQIFDEPGDREDTAMWSRRIHALRRFSDPEVAKIVANQDQSKTIYLPFKNRASLQYLYRQIDGRGEDPTPFRVVDKIRLTKAIIDAQFDCDALVENRLLEHHLCVHTHHTDGIDTSIDMLRVQWGALMSPLRLYRHGLSTLGQLPSYQPLIHIRNYFGEELALYCAYTSFCVSSLQWLCAIAVPVAMLHAMESVVLPSHWYYIGFAIVSTAFIQAFIRKWDVQERTLALEWGVSQVKSADTPRPQFQGTMIVSPITHRRELWYSPQRRQLKRLGSAALLVGLGLAMLGLNYTLLSSAIYTDAIASCGMLTVHGFVAVFAKLWSGPLASLSKRLTDWENYKLQQDHDVNLTLKFAILQSVNLFGLLWLLTFAVPVLSPDKTSRDLDPHQEAAHLLMTFLGVELLVAVWELRMAVVDALASLLPSYSGSASNDRRRLLSPTLTTISALETQLTLDPYKGVMFDYAQITITLGFVAWFSALAPLVSVAAWAVAALQIRADAFNLSVRTQRPFPTQKNSIGSWTTYLRVLAFGAWVHNAALAVLYMSSSTSHLQTLSDPLLLHDVVSDDAAEAERLATETLLLVVFTGFGVVAGIAGVHDQRDRVQLRQLCWRTRRDEHLEHKYIDNLDRVPDAIRDALPSGRVFLNGVHLYVVTGNKAEEDAAEEILDELVQLQLRHLQLEKQRAELRASDAPVGTLVIEIGNINILPAVDALTKAVDSFVQLQLTTPTEIKPKKTKPVNTSVVKKNRSPQWTESFELALDSLDDVLVARVFDWELLGKNRRIGSARLDVADIVATALPLPQPSQPSPGRRQSIAMSSSLASPSEGKAAPGTDAAAATGIPVLPPSSPTAPRVRMASFEVAIDLREVLLSSMHTDLVKHGHPKLSLRGGVLLEPLGRLLLQQRQLRTKMKLLKDKEKKFFEWKG